MDMTFTELKLHPEVQAGIDHAGYVECTPVQGQVLQMALEGDDLYVQSQTGTGKTAAFIVAILQELLTREDLKGKKALIMEPTRELAVQVEEEAKKLAFGTRLTAASFYGGVGYKEQAEALRNNVDIIVGTPGRVMDLEESRTMDLSTVGFLVIDEADRMFDMGFYPDLRRLIKKLPKNAERQTMLFSATLNAYVKNLAWEYTENAREITIEAAKITVDEIDQHLYHVSSNEKTKLLLHVLHSEAPSSVLIFCNTKRMCEITAKRLRMNGFETEFIIGDMPQVKRLQVLNLFKEGKIRCLTATDVAARGIDVDDLAMVINYDVPNEAENYVHRIGRTARAGKTGKAYTFCSEQDVYDLIPIERYLGFSIPVSPTMDDLDAVEDKSAGVYIRLDTYDDERGHRDFGDRRESDRRGSRDRRENNRSDNRGEHRGRRENEGPREKAPPLALRASAPGNRPRRSSSPRVASISPPLAVKAPPPPRREGSPPPRRDDSARVLQREDLSRHDSPAGVSASAASAAPRRHEGAVRHGGSANVSAAAGSPRPEGTNRRGHRVPPLQASPELLGLSMEDRMQVYKKKYRQDTLPAQDSAPPKKSDGGIFGKLKSLFSKKQP